MWESVVVRTLYYDNSNMNNDILDLFGFLCISAWTLNGVEYYYHMNGMHWIHLEHLASDRIVQTNDSIDNFDRLNLAYHFHCYYCYWVDHYLTSDIVPYAAWMASAHHLPVVLEMTFCLFLGANLIFTRLSPDGFPKCATQTIEYFGQFFNFLPNKQKTATWTPKTLFNWISAHYMINVCQTTVGLLHFRFYS